MGARKKLAAAIRQQAQWVYQGRKYTNDMAPLVAEYNQRKRLAEIGFTDSLDALEPWKAEAFVLIGQTYDEEYERKRKMKGK